MTTVLVLISNSISSSIPLEIAAKADEYEDLDIVVGSFFETNQSEFDEDIHKYGLDIVPLEGSRRTDQAAYRRLIHLARQRDVDILHTHHNAIGSLARLVFARSDIHIVTTEHRNHQSFTTLQRWLNFPSYWTIEDLVANSNTTQSSYSAVERLLTRTADHHVVYNGVDIDRIDEARRRIERPDESGTQLVTVGRLVDIKNHPCIVEAFAQLCQGIDNIELVVVGDGPRRGSLERLATERGIADHVRFVGKVPRYRVYGILAQSDLFVISSRSEGFCVAAVEAMACGLPVVASDIPTLREVLGEEALFASPDQPGEFAVAVERLVNDETLRSELGLRGRNRVREKFTLEQTAKRYYEIYNAAASNTNRN